jgi:riboflavin biosynthesis pyrimidine reductase
VEGGPHLGSALIGAGLADDVILLTGSKSLGYEGLPVMTERARTKLFDAAFYHCAETRFLGEDRLIRFERKF